MGRRVRLAVGRGPLGTGVLLLGRRPVGADEWVARPWLCLLTLPLIPLRPARFRGPWAAPAGEAWEVERVELVRAPMPELVRTAAGALGALLLGVGPGFYAWTSIHETGLVEALRVSIGAAAPILVLAWRDLRAPRVVR